MASAPTHHPTPAARPLIIALWLALCAGLATAQPIRHALAQQQSSHVITYELEVLQLLLDKTRPSHGDYALQATEVVTQNRAFLQLQAGAVDVLSSMSSTEREAQGLALRVCLYRGLLGVRLPVVLAGRAAELDALEQPEQLRHGQVSDWPDSQILLANGWRVERMPRLAAFAELLRRQRIDTFALGAIEVYPIADAHPGLAVLQRWAIAYPSAFYFFVSPKRPELAERLRRGWELALADGSFVALFEQRIGPQLARARLDQRRWFVLNNPLLPPDTPLDKAPYWHPLVRSKLLPALNSGKPRP
ncbi:hypothetical protein [Roseateles cavernae]|uniref:hypothetical protein n=1 Tax=Roseateles cavernae TaxID=3153578 RepID=UPI0032E42391